MNSTSDSFLYSRPLESLLAEGGISLIHAAIFPNGFGHEQRAGEFAPDLDAGHFCHSRPCSSVTTAFRGDRVCHVIVMGRGVADETHARPL